MTIYSHCAIIQSKPHYKHTSRPKIKIFTAKESSIEVSVENNQ